MLLEKNNQFQNDDFSVYTVAQLKGRRLRMARTLTGYSRHDLCEKIGIATSTMDTWECGRVELTEKSAVRVCNAFLKVGLYCSNQWLLTGKGEPPRLVEEENITTVTSNREFAKTNKVLSNVGKLIRPKVPVFSDESVRKELEFFLNLHKDAVFHVVENGGFNFRYKVGDCVAGVCEDLRNLVGKMVIGVLKNEKTILCRIVSYSNAECTVYLNSNNSQKKIELKEAAEIIWHRSVKFLTF